MSGIRLIINALYAKGGGPLPRPAIESVGTGRYAFERARDLGLIRFVRDKYRCSWVLTPKGFDVCEGRARLMEPYNGKDGRTGIRVGATWLAMLPVAEVRRGA